MTTTRTSAKLPSWQQALKLAVRSNQRLRELLQLPSSPVASPSAQASTQAAETSATADFPVFAPLEYIERMKIGDAADPLLRQILAAADEAVPAENSAGTSDLAAGLMDPVGDMASLRTAGLLQKYPRRVLVIASGACAIHCRYCFRRHFPYETAPKGLSGWQSWLDEIRSDETIDEVILSGGDPLSVADTTLAPFIHALNRIEHVKRIRLHTRFPVVIPQRVCPPLLDWVSSSRAKMYIVLHVNHANEIDDHVRTAIAQLKSAGAVLLNQAVLLRGVNDSLDALHALCLSLVDEQVLPYYLHQLDPVRGAMHFEVADVQARELIEQLRALLPGYAVPQLVREIQGESSKTPL